MVQQIGIRNKNTYSHFDPKMSLFSFQKIPIIGITFAIPIMTFSYLITFLDPSAQEDLTTRDMIATSRDDEIWLLAYRNYISSI